MTDPKREAAVAALGVALAVAYRDGYQHNRQAKKLLDAMLANPQPFLAVLPDHQRAMAVVEALTVFQSVGNAAAWEAVEAALTETAAEPAREHVYYCGTCGKTRMVEWLHRDCAPEPARSKEPTDAE